MKKRLFRHGTGMAFLHTDDMVSEIAMKNRTLIFPLSRSKHLALV